MRRVFFDTETTGTSVRDGHRIIEIGCIETIDFEKTGRTFHAHLNPEREIDEAATKVHGKTLEMLKNERKFYEIADEFISFVDGAELIAHNAGFDISFANYELSLASKPVLRNEITDSLMIARRFFPGQPASLDALCKRFEVDNSSRTLHGALLDADLLCDMFRKMIDFLENKSGFAGSFSYKVKKQEIGAIKRQANFAYRKFPIPVNEMEKHMEFLKTLGF
jgi:DNA polymerase-3 subunit epsilon